MADKKTSSEPAAPEDKASLDEIAQKINVSTEETPEDVTSDPDSDSNAQSEDLNDNFLGDESSDEDIDKNRTIEEAEADAKAEEAVDELYKQDSDIDEAVDDIVREESDEAIADADAKIAALNAKKEKKSFKQKIQLIARKWWDNKPVRYGTLAGLFILLIVSVLLPTSRYAILNTFGVRVSSSMTIVDSQTRLPLRDIQVQLQDQVLRTDQEGNAQFDGLKLGDSQLMITKRGYAERNETIVLGWGSNPIGEQSLVATGEQFVFVLRDWKSNEPIRQAEAVAGENNARADDSGKITLTVGEEDIANVTVTINAENYRSEELVGAELDSSEREVLLIPAKKHAFVSNRDGQYDVYVIDADGENEQRLLEATGSERDIPAIQSHPTKNIAAVVSSRDGEENDDGFVLDGLFMLNLDDGNLEKVTRSEQLRIVGWSGDRLVFSQVVEGTSRGNPERSKLFSYNIENNEKVELARANYFNDVELVGQDVYYAVSSFAVPQSQAKLYSVRVDGSETFTVLDRQVWNIYRSAYNTLLFNAADQKWFEQQGDSQPSEVNRQPAISRNFVDSPNGERTTWVEVRDGKGVLLQSTTETQNDSQVLSLAGMTDVLYWMNETTLIVRVISSSETADYLVYIDADQPKAEKLVDVTATQRLYY